MCGGTHPLLSSRTMWEKPGRVTILMDVKTIGKVGRSPGGGVPQGFCPQPRPVNTSCKAARAQGAPGGPSGALLSLLHRALV